MRLRTVQFLGAIDLAVKRKRKRKHLAEYLRSAAADHGGLTADETSKLADFIDGKLNRMRGRPRNPRRLWRGANPLMQVAAWEVEDLKAEWRSDGRRYGIHEKAVAQVADKWNVDCNTLNDFIQRGKPPRKNQ